MAAQSHETLPHRPLNRAARGQTIDKAYATIRLSAKTC